LSLLFRFVLAYFCWSADGARPKYVLSKFLASLLAIVDQLADSHITETEERYMSLVWPVFSNVKMLTTKAPALGAVLILLFCSVLGKAQESSGQGRFEVGTNFTALHTPPAGALGSLGPGLQAGVNFGRYFALDAAFSWLPSNSPEGYTLVGLFGGKAGMRTKHYGLFGKVRPGFVTIENALRSSTLIFPAPTGTARFDPLTQRALDLGGVVEYYPTRRWALRWDAGDTLIFEEEGPLFTAVLPGIPPISFRQTPRRMTNHFQFGASVLYRF
jgi:hypothetical protein